jgi:hypothetical protein
MIRIYRFNSHISFCVCIGLLGVLWSCRGEKTHNKRPRHHKGISRENNKQNSQEKIERFLYIDYGSQEIKTQEQINKIDNIDFESKDETDHLKNEKVKEGESDKSKNQSLPHYDVFTAEQMSFFSSMSIDKIFQKLIDAEEILELLAYKHPSLKDWSLSLDINPETYHHIKDFDHLSDKDSKVVSWINWKTVSKTGSDNNTYSLQNIAIESFRHDIMWFVRIQQELKDIYCVTPVTIKPGNLENPQKRFIFHRYLQCQPISKSKNPTEFVIQMSPHMDYNAVALYRKYCSPFLQERETDDFSLNFLTGVNPLCPDIAIDRFMVVAKEGTIYFKNY